MKLKITIDSKVYEIEVEAAEPEPHHPAGFQMFQSSPVRLPATPVAKPVPPASGGVPVNEDKVLRSPISGIVVKVNVQNGQQIQTGDTILVLEAMKMETNITAPMDGKVAQIHVNQTDGVQSGQVLVEFE